MKTNWGEIYMNDYGVGLYNILTPIGFDPIYNRLMKLVYPIKRNGLLNIVVVRNVNTLSNKFDDLLYTFRLFESGFYVNVYSITSDPGTWWLLNGFKKGTAVIKPQYVKGMWKFGKHKGQYDALVQNKPCWVIRDFNKDNIVDFNWDGIHDDKSIYQNEGYTVHDYFLEDKLVRREEYGNFGINLHRSNPTTVSQFVDKWSGGCIVIFAGFAYNHFMSNVMKDINAGFDTFDVSVITAHSIING